MSKQDFNSKPEVGICPRVIGTTCRARIDKVKRALCLNSLSLIFLLITGCDPTTSTALFRSNFDSTPVDQPPAQAQAVGTATVEGGVRVAVIPGTNVKGVKFNRINGASTAVLRCDLAQHSVDGKYVFSTSVYFPSGSGGLATIQFESGAGNAFMHLDFPFVNDTTGHVRIDDDENTAFGQTKRDQLFIVQVTLNISASSANAHIVISGAGDITGEATRNINTAFLQEARQFGRVKISSGLQADDSTFFATNIVVTRQ